MVFAMIYNFFTFCPESSNTKSSLDYQGNNVKKLYGPHRKYHFRNLKKFITKINKIIIAPISRNENSPQTGAVSKIVVKN